jgi:hypothetical protein
LYVPGRLIQALAALHGCIVLHSSTSSEQSIPVHPGSKYQNQRIFSFEFQSSYHKHMYNYLVNQYNDYVLDMDLIDIHQLDIDIDHQQNLKTIFRINIKIISFLPDGQTH